MEKINRHALVMFSAEQMFRLVDDIASYPEFVPYCQQAEIISRTENEVTARLEIAKRGIAKSFSTKNTLVPFRSIQMQLIDGPFESFSGHWQFNPLTEEACKIALSLEFEFSNKLASMAFAAIFNQLTHSMVNAFTERAVQVYGKN
ncbi:type II toxin-antitoxin system RatA family toxin [Aliikangiella maris]|uniref:Type II toxin-antitoxin system RatA family toxin n=2 Tax=Aliikangiella maris TaxID=3162458 RepID=A0ABV2BXE1_9GAMM